MTLLFWGVLMQLVSCSVFFCFECCGENFAEISVGKGCLIASCGKDALGGDKYRAAGNGGLGVVEKAIFARGLPADGFAGNGLNFCFAHNFDILKHLICGNKKRFRYPLLKSIKVGLCAITANTRGETAVLLF